MQTVTAPSPPGRSQQAIDDYAMERIDYRVRDLAQRFGLDEAEQDDYRLEMVVQLLGAMTRFNRQKAKRQTFVNRVLDRFVLHAKRAHCTRIRQSAMSPILLDDVHLGFDPRVNDARRGELDEQAQLDLKMDLEAIIDRMPERLQRVCKLLSYLEPAEAARKLGIHPRSIYRIIGEIRQHFEAAGLGKT